MLNFTYNGRRYEGWTAKDALDAGVPEGTIAAVKQGLRRRAVSAECRRRISRSANEYGDRCCNHFCEGRS